MYYFFSNKITSIVITCLLIITLAIQYPQEHYSLLLILLMFLVYGHFFMSTYYQLRKPITTKNYRYIFYFCLTTFLTLLSLIALQPLGLVTQLGVCALLVFCFHAVLSEQLHLQILAKTETPLHPWIALGSVVAILYVVSLNHPSFFFNTQGIFMDITSLDAPFLLQNIISPFWFYGLLISFFITFTVCALLPILQKNFWLFLITFCSSSAVFYYLVFFTTPIYIYLFFFVLIFHTVSWAIFAYQTKRNPKDILELSLVIGIIHIGLGILLFLDTGILNQISSWLYNFETFIIFTYFHITTSLLNESWIKRRLHI